MAKPELRDHRKFLKLKRLLKEPTPHVLGYLDCLWHRGYQTGNPNVGDALDVEAAAEFPGEAGTFTKAAHDAGFIDENGDGTFSIHDLYQHAPAYAQKRMARRGTAPNGTLPSVKPKKRIPRGTKRSVAHSARNEMESESFRAEQSGAQSLDPRTKNQEPKTENQKPKKEEEGRPTAPAGRFIPPTETEVAAYCRERKNTVDPGRFVDFYASKGWRVGDQAMKDWRAAVRTWENRETPHARDPPPAPRTIYFSEFADKLIPTGTDGTHG